MSLSEKYLLSASFIFLIIGLLTGVWKYYRIARSKNATAPIYIDIAHRASLLYSFACLVLSKFASLSVFMEEVNAWSALVTIFFFGFAISTYLIHGILEDTENQFKSPHLLGKFRIPKWIFHSSMFALIVGELGGTMILGIGALRSIW